MTTTQDFTLRLLAPCVQLSRQEVTQFLKPGESGTVEVSIQNLGAGMANWQVDERTGPFQPPSDIPWISESPITGTLGSDATQVLDVTCEALTGMAAGMHTGYVVVNTDDPNAARAAGDGADGDRYGFVVFAGGGAELIGKRLVDPAQEDEAIKRWVLRIHLTDFYGELENASGCLAGDV